MTRTTISRAVRLARLIEMLRAGEEVLASDAAEMFACSQRSLERDILELQQPPFSLRIEREGWAWRLVHPIPGEGIAREEANKGEYQVPLEVYDQLEKATPEERANAALRLIEEHPEHRLELPARDGKHANLSSVDLSPPVLREKLEKLDAVSAPWWDADLQGANLKGANLREANLQGANLEHANLQEANLEHADVRRAYLGKADLQMSKLFLTDFRASDLNLAIFQGADVYKTDFEDADLSHANFQSAVLMDSNPTASTIEQAERGLEGIYLFRAFLHRTELNKERLGEGIGEEHDRRWFEAKEAYLALNRDFEEIGRYDDAGWAYRKERQMEKLMALQRAKDKCRERNWRKAAQSSAKAIGLQVVELICGYGESISRVLSTMAIVWILFALVYGLAAGVWGPWEETAAERIRRTTWNPIHLLAFSVGAMTTMEPAGLEARSCAIMRILVPLEAFLGIALAGLLGFVIGNRIRRS